MKFFFAILLILSLISPITTQNLELKGVDLYGTDKITVKQVQQRVGGKIQKLANAFSKGDFGIVETLYQEVQSEICKMGEFAYAELSIVGTPGDGIYITVDIVEEKDRAARMTFAPAPTKEFADPDGLLAAWHEYQEAGFEMMRTGESDGIVKRCPALHCILGFDSPKLKKYEDIFQKGVPKHQQALIQVLREDKNSEHRAYAAFLLAHTSDASALVQTLLPSLTDSNSTVRNNVMRVIAEIAEKHKEAWIPIEPFIKALDYPSATDRNKALYVMSSLATNPKHKSVIIDQAGERLLKILRLTQPNNHDFAFIILKQVSGQIFGERDYDAWGAWLKQAKRN